VEGQNQESELYAKGCQQGQGLVFGKAVPAEQTQAFFSAQTPEKASSSA
jgi:sensor c-di-GMP phosphodiesterase-like protein